MFDDNNRQRDKPPSHHLKPLENGNVSECECRAGVQALPHLTLSSVLLINCHDAIKPPSH